MKEPDGAKQVLLVDHVEGQCRAIVGFKDDDPRSAYMCGEPVYQRRGKKQSSWCAYHYRQMHATAVDQQGVTDQVRDMPKPVSIARNP
ncbi:MULTISPECIES: hypothetical protein [Bradyrhizobium]|uniref:hypothetical protein n=1 Tax=Bradyrhizobium TaxID=374 RepID=UPI000B264363|nr:MULTISPECIES: hypothetical protein [Bradyrhizobium]